MSSDRDLGFMEMAYGLAGRARGCASPNPLVGSVIVRRGSVVGCGYHAEAGKPHAEIMALRMAGLRAKGATIYITLEPCVHWGRTPPCVDSLLSAGLARAVISAHDPNPLVHRRGAARLRAAGLEVSVGLLGERNARLNEAYIKFITRKVPFVTLKAAISLDGQSRDETVEPLTNYFLLRAQQDLNEGKTTIGATYHSKTRLSDLEAKEATVSFNVDINAGPTNLAIPVSGKMTVKDFQWPETYGIGIAYEASEKWILAADYKRINWAAVMKDFKMEFTPAGRDRGRSGAAPEERTP